MRHIAVLFAAAAVFCGSARNACPEQVPAAFADIGYGARPMGMAGAYTAVSNDANAIAWNPAGLALLKGREGIFMNTNQKNLIPYSYAVYGQRLFSGIVIGGGAVYSGDEALSETTVMYSMAKPISYRYWGYGYYRKTYIKTCVGATYKLRLAEFGNNSDGGPDRITGSAQGHTIDVGLLTELKDRFFLGLAIHEFAGVLMWDSSSSGEYQENIPRTFVMGMSYMNPGKVVVAGDLEYPGRIRLGVEKKVAGILALRLGYNQKLDKEAVGEYSAGIGLDRMELGLISVAVNISYRIERLADTMRMSASVRF